MNTIDKRRSRRFPMHLPVDVKSEAGQTEPETVQTRDVSSNGVYFQFGAPLNIGSSVEFQLTLPEPLTKGSPVRIRCIGKVVRVDQEEKEDSEIGIAATIERYEFVRDE